MVVRKAEQKASSKEKLSELKCAKWWYQWLSQALLIKAEQSVVLVRFTRVPVRGHYERMEQTLARSRQVTCGAITE